MSPWGRQLNMDLHFYPEGFFVSSSFDSIGTLSRPHQTFFLTASLSLNIQTPLTRKKTTTHARTLHPSLPSTLFAIGRNQNGPSAIFTDLCKVGPHPSRASFHRPLSHKQGSCVWDLG
ncbi:hypothetical protein BgiMline_009351 [Biomphalaria glabrata]|nr:hypothetical protein BgiMline_023482 [Biomphalaria glabrata]